MKLKLFARWQGLRTRREFIADLRRRAAAGAEVAVGIALLVAALGWATERDLRDAEAPAIERAQAAEAKAHKMLAHVLNGRPLIEHDTGTVLFVQVSRQEGL